MAADTANRGGLDLGVAQVAASALAAVTSAVAASTLGVAGTIVGAGVGAVVATVGSAVYTHSLRRAGARLRDLRPPDDGRWPAPRPPRSTASGQAGPLDEPAEHAAAAPPGAAVPVDATAAQEPAARRSWRRGALVVGAGFVLALAGVTGAEAVLGHPLSSSKETGTSVGRAVTGGSGGARTPSTTPATSTPSSSVTSETSTMTPSSVPLTTTSVPSASASPGLSAPSESSSPGEPTTSSTSAPQQSAPASPAPVAPTSTSGQ